MSQTGSIVVRDRFARRSQLSVSIRRPQAAVACANVYNTNGDALGEVYDVMIDKVSGKIAYAVMSFGGFLGMGNRYHPLPWNTLKYDTRQGGYVVGMTKQQLERAPAYASTETPAWGDRNYEKGIHDYYGAAPYWMW